MTEEVLDARDLPAAKVLVVGGEVVGELALIVPLDFKVAMCCA